MKTVITQEQHTALLQLAFDQVCDKEDWKAPIDCIVPHDTVSIYEQAIEFMTGVKPDSELTALCFTPMYRLTCVGYRNGPCGD